MTARLAPRILVVRRNPVKESFCEESMFFVFLSLDIFLYGYIFLNMARVRDWVKMYERYWRHQLSRMQQRAEQKMTERMDKELTQHKEEGKC